MNEFVGPPTEYFISSANQQTGGTVVVDGVETVIVEKSRGIDYRKLLTVLAIGFAVWALLGRKNR